MKDVEKTIKGELMGSIILDVNGLVESVFPPISPERPRGEHDPICLENDPAYSNHLEVPLEKPDADSEGTTKGIDPSDNVPAEKTPAPDDPSNPSRGRGGNKSQGPKIPKLPPCRIIDDVS